MIKVTFGHNPNCQGGGENMKQIKFSFSRHEKWIWGHSGLLERKLSKVKPMDAVTVRWYMKCIALQE